jgi:hypothetical protein
MSKAFNLSLLANNVDSSGQLDGGAVNGPVAIADVATSFATANFSISQAGGKLVFYYGTNAIASMDSSGNLVQLNNVTAYGTP